MSLMQQMAKQFLSSKSMDDLEADVKAILPDIPIDHLYRLYSLLDDELSKPLRLRQRLDVVDAEQANASNHVGKLGEK